MSIEQYTDEELEAELKQRKKPKFPAELVLFVHDEQDEDEELDEWLERHGEDWSNDVTRSIQHLTSEIKLTYSVDKDGNATLLRVDDKKVEQ